MADYESRKEKTRRLAEALTSHSIGELEYSKLLQRMSDDAIAFRKSHPHFAGYELKTTRYIIHR